MIRILPGLSAQQRAESSRKICEMIRADCAWINARTIGFFAPQPGEPDIELLWNDLRDQTICYPRVNGDALEFFSVEHVDALVPGRWKLREPAPTASSKPVDVGCLDLVLVPGLAFTRDGARLGRGGGFYDRFLSQPHLRARKVGVCFAAHVLGELPVESHDQRVDRVVAA